MISIIIDSDIDININININIDIDSDKIHINIDIDSDKYLYPDSQVQQTGKRRIQKFIHASRHRQILREHHPEANTSLRNVGHVSRARHPCWVQNKNVCETIKPDILKYIDAYTCIYIYNYIYILCIIYVYLCM